MTLDDIIEAARKESQERQRKYPLPMIQREAEKKGPGRGFLRALSRHKFSVIAEIKRRSPSMGEINERAIWEAYAIYHSHPLVSAISVLTQEEYFGGTMDDLKKVRSLTQRRPKPILRKDFIFDEYEVYFSRWIGADAILLMANVVTDVGKFQALHDLALSIGLDVLCEVHDETEIDVLPESAKICGINSRRFKGVDQKKSVLLSVRELLGRTVERDTKTDLSTFQLFDRLPPHSVKVAESGISGANIADVLRQHPFNAALIGTSLLKAGREGMKVQLDKIQAEAEKALAVDAGASLAAAASGR